MYQAAEILFSFGCVAHLYVLFAAQLKLTSWSHQKFATCIGVYEYFKENIVCYQEHILS